MERLLRDLPQRAKEKHAENKRYFAKLRKTPPTQLDYVMEELHDAEFTRTDCLKCANCCKTTGPLFTNADIARIAKHFRMKPSQFIATYLRVDEDNDYILQQVPCSFLDAENHCLIYDIRPKACREFPHTNRRKFHQIAPLTLKNVGICPAAFNIVEAMKERIKL